MKPKLIIISGPTATGKSALALQLAQKYGLAIVNFDSLCFYRELSIGTAKPTLEERQNIAHFMIDVASITSPLNAADYVRLARPLMHQLYERYPALILVGGSGFYLKALLQGMYESPTTPPDILKKSAALYAEQGISPFWQLLQEHDPVNAQALHPNDHYRIRRAVEHFWSHGRPFSLAAAEQKKDLPDWDILHLYLDLPKKEHYQLILSRTQQMWERGLIEEVRGLLAQGFSGNERPLGSIGYKEALAYLRGEIATEQNCQERISIATRQLAKAQRTWFKKVQDKYVLNPLEDQDKCGQLVSAFLSGVR